MTVVSMGHGERRELSAVSMGHGERSELGAERSEVGG